MVFRTRVLLQHRQPMIRFLGRRHKAPAVVDHEPHPHPASPKDTLPDSFATYRSKAVQHGPLGGRASTSSSKSNQSSLPIAGRSGHQLGSVQPPTGEYFDRDDLPKRFHRTTFTEKEIEAIESGGASMW